MLPLGHLLMYARGGHSRTVSRRTIPVRFFLRSNMFTTGTDSLPSPFEGVHLPTSCPRCGPPYETIGELIEAYILGLIRTFHSVDFGQVDGPVGAGVVQKHLAVQSELDVARDRRRRRQMPLRLLQQAVV